jgi:hypothetical protein
MLRDFWFFIPMDQHKTSIKTICSLHALNAGATFYQRVNLDGFVKSPAA